jgi:uncharacterized protein YceH (UPF0502 family)
VEPDAVEIRVLGCLIEKQRTTPDQYPLSLNALRNACNQTTNRHPVVNYDEETIRGALHRLGRRRYTRLASGHTSRARKYRHLLDDAFGLDDAEISLVAVLMLRGPQTPGELKQRAGRLHDFSSLADVQETLDGLVERELVARHSRRPGQKEDRYEQLLGGAMPGVEPAAKASGEAPPGRSSEEAPGDDLKPAEDRLTRLEREVTELRTELAALRDELGG